MAYNEKQNIVKEIPIFVAIVTVLKSPSLVSWKHVIHLPDIYGMGKEINHSGTAVNFAI